jgi:CBS domain-containing protein
MKSEQVRRIPVVEGDRLVGIIAQADVAREGRDRKTGDVVERISEPTRGK